ncbi:MAG: VCBS repeat-containing protein [Verrucomicrobiae bacterium]|nr:VCBS repeat-containing protein [Verrucomicrobiae bacterium]
MKFASPILILVLSISSLSAGVSWQKNSADLGEVSRGIDTADFDGDGNLDVLAIGEIKVYIISNPTRNKHPEVLYDSVGGTLLYAASGDMDDDGDEDFVIARGTSPWIDYREMRARREKASKPKGVPDFSVAWIENTGELKRNRRARPIDTELNGCHGLAIADLSEDGVLDVIGNSIKGNWKDSIAWYDNFEGKFVRHMIIQQQAPERPHYMVVADINRDGKQDVIVAHSGGNDLSWYENPPAMHGFWEKHVIAQDVPGVTNTAVADLDGDGRLDVVASNGHGIGVNWYRGNTWKPSVIDQDLPDCHALAVGDFDLDGDLDVATASFSAHIVRWYENSGVGVFRAHDIEAGNGQEAYDLKTADLNKDGRLDLLLAGRGTKNAVWYINQPE